MNELTAADLARGVTKALKARDLEAAVAILRVMAVHYPHEAAEIHAAIELGLANSEQEHA